MINDDLGVTLAVAVYPTNRIDCITLEDTIDKMLIPNIKEIEMKSMTFVNERNGEQVICDDVRAVQVIDGIDYLVVHKQDNPRPFMMRKDALKKVNGVGSVMAARLSVKQ